MVRIIAQWDGLGMTRLHQALAHLSKREASTAWRRALNHTAAKGKTHIIRLVAKEMGLPQKAIRNRRAIKLHRASQTKLEATVVGIDGFMPMKDFKPTQLNKGVKASPWGQRRMFKSTFIVNSLGGHVWKRTSKSRLPIEKLYGPAIPIEMLSRRPSTEWWRMVKGDLPPRIEHEVHRLTDGIFR